MSNTIRELLAAGGNCVEVHVDQAQQIDANAGRVHHYEIDVRDARLLREKGIDAFINAAVFGTPVQQATARWLIWELGRSWACALHRSTSCTSRAAAMPCRTPSPRRQ